MTASSGAASSGANGTHVTTGKPTRTNGPGATGTGTGAVGVPNEGVQQSGRGVIVMGVTAFAAVFAVLML